MWPPLLPHDLLLARPPAFPAAPVASDSFVSFDIGGVLIELGWDAFFEAGSASAPRARGETVRPATADAFLEAPFLPLLDALAGRDGGAHAK